MKIQHIEEILSAIKILYPNQNINIMTSTVTDGNNEGKVVFYRGRFTGDNFCVDVVYDFDGNRV